MSRSNVPAQPATYDSFEWELLKIAAGVLVLLVLGPFTLAEALLLALLCRGRLRWLLWPLTLPAALGTIVSWPTVRAGLEATARALHGHGDQSVISHPSTALADAWPHLWPVWVATMSLGPLLALLLLHRETPNVDAVDAGRERKQTLRVERRAAAKAKASAVKESPPRKQGLFLGYTLGGDPLLPVRRGRVYLPLGRLSHHLLVAGATGSGKTETVLRLVDSVARSTDWRIVVIDGKGDRATQRRFVALMQHRGRTVTLFPETAHDGWRGEAQEIAGRLLALIDFAQEGGGAFYRDLAVNTIRLACLADAGPPTSSQELLRRLTRPGLLELYPPRSPGQLEIDGLTREQLDGIRARYAAFFGLAGDALDGQHGFAESDCSYYRLDGLRLKHEAGHLARFLVEDFTQWASGSKPYDERVLLVVDEFSAIAQAGQGLVDVVERARGFGVACVLCPQVAEGMGSPEAAARIMGSAQTILLHATPSPELLVRVAGTRRYQHTTRQLEGDRLTGLGSVRVDEQYRADPNQVRRLKAGQCYAIGSGLAMKLQIAPAPSLPALSASSSGSPHRTQEGDA